MNGKSLEMHRVFFFILFLNNKTKVKLNLQSFDTGRTWLRTNTIKRFPQICANLLFTCLHFQTGAFWKCSGFSRAGFRAGVRYPDGHGAGHRVPRVPSGDPLGSVFVDASPGAGGSCCCWAHQRGFHRWVICLAYRCPFVNEGIPTILRKGFQSSDHNQKSYIVQVWKKPTYLENQCLFREKKRLEGGSARVKTEDVAAASNTQIRVWVALLCQVNTFTCVAMPPETLWLHRRELVTGGWLSVGALRFKKSSSV